VKHNIALSLIVLLASCASPLDTAKTDPVLINMDDSVGQSSEAFGAKFIELEGDLIYLRGRLEISPQQFWRDGRLYACEGMNDGSEFIPKAASGIATPEEDEIYRQARRAGAFGWIVSYSHPTSQEGLIYNALAPDVLYKGLPPIKRADLSALHGKCNVYLAEVTNRIEITSISIVSNVITHNIYDTR